MANGMQIVKWWVFGSEARPLPFAVEQLLFKNDALPVVKVRLCAFVTKAIPRRT